MIIGMIAFIALAVTVYAYLYRNKKKCAQSSRVPFSPEEIAAFEEVLNGLDDAMLLSRLAKIEMPKRDKDSCVWKPGPYIGNNGGSHD